MNDRIRHFTAVTTRIALAAAVVLVAAGVATETEAHGRHHRHKQHFRAHGMSPGHGFRVAPVIVPRFIRPSSIAIYRPFYANRIWFAGHRHFHAMYRFPVATSYGVAYRDYAYCNDAVFEDDRYRGYDRCDRGRHDRCDHGDRYEAYDRHDDRYDDRYDDDDIDGYVEFHAPHARIGVRF